MSMMADSPRQRFLCGPLAVTVTAQDPVLRDKAADTLGLYNVEWDRPHLEIGVHLHTTDSPARMLAGTYLVCRFMNVDLTETGLRASCESGAWGLYDQRRERWEFFVPSPEGRGLVDIENLLGLVLTTGWRRLGWVPLHAAAVVRDGRCAILCASSGGGKSTLAAAMLHRGWHVVGDDKLLLRLGQDRQSEIVALLHNLNLHPQTRDWFPEVEQIERLPAYSAWTPKRRVSAREIWPDQTAYHAHPSHLVQIERRPDPSGFGLVPMSQNDLLSILLRQTVIPREKAVARQILDTVAATARQLHGLRLEIGDDAYRDSAGLAVLESALL
jgi:hypothetical protein